MNLKNVAIYTGLLLFVVCFGIFYRNALIELQNSPYFIVNGASLDYINKLNAGIESNNFNKKKKKSVSEYQEDSIFLSEENEGSSSITDILANLNFYKKIQQKFINPAKFIFNIPSFLLTIFNLPVEPFTILTTILNLVLYIGLVSMILWNLK